MLDQTTKPPIGIHLLADHLDATLAAGEDLLSLRLEPAADAPPGVAPEERLAKFVADVRQHEAALLLRLLQARRRAESVVTTDFALKTVLKLIATGTASLADLAQRFGHNGRDGVGSGEDVQHVLRQRGLIADDAGSVSPFEVLRVDDAFRVGGVLPLGGLLDMAASALDLIDRQYNLYRDDEDAEREYVGEEGAKAAAEDTTAAPTALQAALDEVAAVLAVAPGAKTASPDPAAEVAKPEAEPKPSPATAEAGPDAEDSRVTAGSLRAALAELNAQT